jgi:hypothetical protein
MKISVLVKILDNNEEFNKNLNYLSKDYNANKVDFFRNRDANKELNENNYINESIGENYTTEEEICNDIYIVDENLDDAISERFNEDFYFNEEFNENYYTDEEFIDDSIDENREEFISEKEYDNNKKQNNYSGNTGPYFPNFTTFLLFLWITKHQIGTYHIINLILYSILIKG